MRSRFATRVFNLRRRTTLRVRENLHPAPEQWRAAVVVRVVVADVAGVVDPAIRAASWGNGSLLDRLGVEWR